MIPWIRMSKGKNILNPQSSQMLSSETLWEEVVRWELEEVKVCNG